ncbi:hypothetical protein HYPBUDRAFT_238737 [Hyphopichia burtonii NRRL Y-1933]|uniref:Zn(2)-C6 fungal-type domain-containing protein n=1 Tax=Hyphopichia burtonii NRRL Y-1933 TaxID=984485 RepID=A0A1E4RNQ9_9ASCO|nr:hypothetical protein HYPBUDRAFT_238737 [Hyphopichia burtonii NRRL Y-1933]ODV68893.1 hypothetical protein HYPBUDRAFT_238737 [Hyphopichia burtonii NRRL Y-1933]
MSIFHLSSFPPARRTKVTRACDPCRKRKVRCTGRAVCPRCMERNLNCTFTIGDLRSSRGAKSKRLNPGADGKKIECIEVSRAISDSGGNVTVLPSIEDIFKQLNIELVSFMKNSGENGLPNMNDIMNALLRAHSKTDLEAIDKSPLSDLLITPPCSGGSYRGSNECFFSIDNNKLMYLGFANCESVVQETKFIFRNIIGITKFDSVEFDPINDIVIEPTIEFLETIPEKHICIQAFNTFVIYVHWQAYLFDEEDFRREIDELFQNSNQIKTRVLLYFILAISTLVHSHDAGNFICDQAVNYFKSAVKLNTTIKDQDDYWLIYFNFFQALFYIYTNKFKTAWLFVENAIKSGEKLNIHKLSIDHPNYDHLVNLFRTLYYYNKLTAITAGKPALFLNEDCHEFTPTNQQYEISRFAKTIKFDSTERINYITNPDNDQLFRSKVYFYRTQLLRIATKIDNSVYNNSEIKVSKFKTLAVELKEWYANLPPDLKVENSSSGNSEDEIKHRYACLHLNSVHLYAIFLLSRPLLMYERTCQFTPEIRNSIPCEFVGEFKNAAYWEFV